MGKTALEPKVHQEVEEYIDHFLKPNLGKPFDMNGNIMKATCNIMTQMVLSRRFDYNDQTLNQILFVFSESIELIAKLAVLENIPFSNIFLRSIQERDVYLNHVITKPLFQGLVNEHRETIDRDQPRDVIDRYFLYFESSEGKKLSSFSGMFTISCFKGLLTKFLARFAQNFACK